MFPTLKKKTPENTIKHLPDISHISLSLCAMVLLTITLARTLDSLVRVPRRVDRNHFVKHSVHTLSPNSWSTAWDDTTRDRCHHKALGSGRGSHQQQGLCSHIKFLFAAVTFRKKTFWAGLHPEQLMTSSFRQPLWDSQNGFCCHTKTCWPAGKKTLRKSTSRTTASKKKFF